MFPNEEPGNIAAAGLCRAQNARRNAYHHVRHCYCRSSNHVVTRPTFHFKEQHCTTCQVPGRWRKVTRRWPNTGKVASFAPHKRERRVSDGSPRLYVVDPVAVAPAIFRIGFPPAGIKVIVRSCGIERYERTTIRSLCDAAQRSQARTHA